MRRILILGVNGFIGHHLSRRILAQTDWEVYGMDLLCDRVAELTDDRRFTFYEGDITVDRAWVERHIKQCDVVLPLVAIATPATYVRDPLRVFELDFEANLPVVRACVEHGTRLVFPSTSEVYGMCRDEAFDPDSSELVLGPINKPRWIYACAKQLMDRVIWAYGMRGALDFTLFRPFNWIGAGLDRLHAAKGSSRVVTQFFGRIVHGEPIELVDGGRARRSFTCIDDGIDALMRIIANHGGTASGQIYNVGNPANNCSIRELALMMLEIAAEYPEYRDHARRARLVEVSSATFYGRGYQDVEQRVPRIDATMRDLRWQPLVPLRDALRKVFDAYREHLRVTPRADAPPRGEKRGEADGVACVGARGRGASIIGAATATEDDDSLVRGKPV